MFLRRYKVSGNSMYPTLKDGEYVIAENLSYRLFSPQTGEMVLFKEPNSGKKMIKRIIFKVPGGYFVKSDSIGWSGFISRKRILGRAVVI